MNVLFHLEVCHIEPGIRKSIFKQLLYIHISCVYVQMYYIARHWSLIITLGGWWLFHDIWIIWISKNKRRIQIPCNSFPKVQYIHCATMPIYQKKNNSLKAFLSWHANIFEAIGEYSTESIPNRYYCFGRNGNMDVFTEWILL